MADIAAMVTLSLHPSGTITVPQDAPAILVTYDLDTDPDAPAVRFDVAANLDTRDMGADETSRMLGTILHVLAHALLNGASINLTPAPGGMDAPVPRRPTEGGES